MKSWRKVYPSTHIFQAIEEGLEAVAGGWICVSAIEVLERQPLRKFHYVLLAITSLIYGLTAMNVMLISVALPRISAEWSLSTPAAGLLASFGYIGMFLGALSSGFIADRIGRKPTMIIMILIGSVFTGLCGLAPGYEIMAAFRLIAGFGLGGTLPLPGVYMSEYPPAKYRGRFVGIVETAWVYGAILSVVFGYILIPEYGWRAAFNAAYIPLILIPFIALQVPESIRFLERRGRIEEIKSIFKRYGLVEDVEGLYLRPQPIQKIGVKRLISGEYLRRTLILWMLWAALVYTYHGIFIWLPSIYAERLGFSIVKSLEWVLIVTLVQVPGYYSAALLLDKVGRKPILAFYLAVAGVASLFLSTTRDINMILIYSCVISFFNLGAWAGLYAYTPELYPTELRGTGSGAAASIGRVAGILAPYLTGYLMYISGGELFYAFLVFALVHLVAAAITGAFGEETKGRRLEEISRI
ncbi:MAG: MFS transporter [Aigarchaeota archaeon]|nr:MFS transporter [Candidatus Wolframiiraptor gerlachensis]